MQAMTRNKLAVVSLALGMLLLTAVFNSAPGLAANKRRPSTSQQAAADPTANEALEVRRERALWRRIAASTEPLDFKEFLDLYPQGQYAAQARARYDELMETPLWESIQNSDDPEVFRQYLEKYPNGKFSRQAQSRADDLAEAMVWKLIEPGDDMNQFIAFLDKYPNGKFAIKAKERLEAAKRHIAEAEARQRAEEEARQRVETEARQRAEAVKQNEAAQQAKPAVAEPLKPAAPPIAPPPATSAPQKEAPPPVNTAPAPAATGTIIISLDIDEPDLEILIDGQKPKSIKPVGKKQIALTDVPCGRHIVSFSHLTIDAFEQEVEVISNTSLYINPTLERAYVLLIIESEPGAELFIDNQRACWGEGEEGKPGESKKGKSVCVLDVNGRTPPLPVTPGEHTIRLRKPGFVGVERQITAANKMNEFPIKLKQDKHGKRRST